MSFSNDIVKYVTQEFVKYIDTPKDNRKKRIKEQWSFRLFGMVPFSLRLVAAQKLARKKVVTSPDPSE